MKRANGRGRRGRGAAALVMAAALGVTAVGASAEVVGHSDPVAFDTIDGGGFLLIYDGGASGPVFQDSGTVKTWGIRSGGAYDYTPVILRKTSATNYTLLGVGQTRTASTAYQTFDFDPIAGTGAAAAGDTMAIYFGSAAATGVNSVTFTDGPNTPNHFLNGGGDSWRYSNFTSGSSATYSTGLNFGTAGPLNRLYQAEFTSVAHETFGATHYTSYSDPASAGAISPFSESGGGPFSDTLSVGMGGRYTVGGGRYFYLENFEDGLLNTPGISVSSVGGGAVSVISSADSVDEDNGAIDGTGATFTLYRDNNGHTARFTFDAAALGGRLPTYFGAAITDGINTASGFGTDYYTKLEAFDINGTSLGDVMFKNDDFLDTSFAGGTAEDVFLGIRTLTGIFRVDISTTDANGNVLTTGFRSFEIDHVQYGAVPTPAALPAGLALLALAAPRRGRRSA